MHIFQKLVIVGFWLPMLSVRYALLLIILFTIVGFLVCECEWNHLVTITNFCSAEDLSFSSLRPDNLAARFRHLLWLTPCSLSLTRLCS